MSRHYGSPSGGSRYDVGDPETRGGSGPSDPESNLEKDAEHSRVECPRCEREVGHLANHIHSNDCNPPTED